MTIEVMSVITIFSIACSVFFGYRAFMRNKEQDDKLDATQIATMMVKLDNIENTVNEIKVDNKTFKLEIQELRERLIKVEGKVGNLEDIVYQSKN